MKQKLFRILSAFLGVILVISMVPTFALAKEDEEREFNIFLDAGEISDEFVSQTSQIIARNWSDDYFSSITMTLGEDVMLVDGEQVELSVVPSLNNEDELFLPVPELAETIGATVKINQQTGNILVETTDGQTILKEFVNDSDFVIQEEYVYNSEITENSQVTMECLENETEGISLQAIQEEQVEELFHLEVSVNKDKVIITKPYQMKEIILYVHDGENLSNDYQAKNSVTNGEGLYFLQYETEEETKFAYDEFLSDASVEYVVLNSVVTTNALPSPGSWGTDGNEYSMGIQASRMINHLQGNDEEILVAVLDSGVDGEYLPGTANGRDGHPHLEGRTTVAVSETDDTAGLNFVDTDNINNNPYDDRGHGTHVAGTIVDCTPDNVKILPVKVLDAEGYGDELSVCYGIQYAAEQGAKVINMSLGSYGCTEGEDVCLTEQAILQTRISALENNQTPPVFVVSSGNDAYNAENNCPAKHSLDFDNVITVGSVDQYDLHDYDSNYGEAVDVCAPGVDIYSSVPGGEYGNMSGTSMAAPHVSAAMAMLILAHSDYSVSQLKTLLKSMTVDLGEPGEDPVFGAGRIDFRMYNSETLPAVTPVAAESISIYRVLGDASNAIDCVAALYSDGTTIPNEKNVKTDVDTCVFPKDATDKSVVYSVADSSIISLENGRLYSHTHGLTKLTVYKDGVGSDSCILYSDRHVLGDEPFLFLPVNSTRYRSQEIFNENDVDMYVFSPRESGTYVFYSEGDRDVDGWLYNANGALLTQRSDKSSTDRNFAITYTLTENQKYFLMVKVGQNDIGGISKYGVFVTRAHYEFNNLELNQDARSVEFNLTTSTIVDKVQIVMNNSGVSTTYVLPKPSTNSAIISSQGIDFNVGLTVDGYSTTWDISCSLPETNPMVRFSLFAGNVSIYSNILNRRLYAYGSSYKTYLTPNDYLSSLLSNMATTGYTFTAYDWNDQQITATTTTKVATGQKIVKKNSSGKIVHVYYLVLFGDVAGSGVVGDGLINATDSMKVLQEIEETFLGAISKLAADADHNGSITQADADLILNHAVGKATINQNVAITQAVDSSCYFQTPVAF